MKVNTKSKCEYIQKPNGNQLKTNSRKIFLLKLLPTHTQFQTTLLNTYEMLMRQKYKKKKSLQIRKENAE